MSNETLRSNTGLTQRLQPLPALTPAPGDPESTRACARYMAAADVVAVAMRLGLEPSRLLSHMGLC
jgi:hypothetical protein